MTTLRLTALYGLGMLFIGCTGTKPTVEGSGGMTAVGGSSSAAGGTHSGGSSGTAPSSCSFAFSTPTVTASNCHVAADSQDSCGDAARCICAGSSNVQACVGGWTIPRGGLTFSDFCATNPASPGQRSLAEALTSIATAYQGTATSSLGCSQIRATLKLGG